MVLYVDGQEMARYNMPSGDIRFSTYTPTYAGDWFEGSLTLDVSLFKKGRHTLAVELHNCSAGSSDLFWDASLTAVLAPTATEKDILSTAASWTLPEGEAVDVVAVAEPVAQWYGTTPCVRINELCASKGLYVSDWFEYADWIELCNATDETVDVAGMYLRTGFDEDNEWCSM